MATPFDVKTIFNFDCGMSIKKLKTNQYIAEGCENEPGPPRIMNEQEVLDYVYEAGLTNGEENAPDTLHEFVNRVWKVLEGISVSHLAPTSIQLKLPLFITVNEDFIESISKDKLTARKIYEVIGYGSSVHFGTMLFVVSDTNKLVPIPSASTKIVSKKE